MSKSTDKTKLRIFLSYASEDKSKVRKLYDQLRIDGLNPWMDREDILPGSDWALAIEKALHTSDVILLCFSRKSVSKEGYIQREYKKAMDYQQEKPEGSIFVIPVRLDNCAMPDFIRKLQWVDYPSGYEKLSQALHVKAGKKFLSQQTSKKQGVHEVEATIEQRLGDFRRVQLILDGDFKRFNNVRKEDLVSNLATLLGVDPESIHILKVYSGSIVIIARITSIAVDRLVELAVNKEPHLTEMGILSVQIEHEKPIVVSYTADENQNGIRFINRQDELNQILSNITSSYYIIEAPAAYGKTMLLNNLQRELHAPERNYLCAYAGGLYKDSFLHVIAELCASFGLPEPNLQDLYGSWEDENAMLQTARELGALHAGMLIGQYFKNAGDSEIYAGVAILIDDIDRIIDHQYISYQKSTRGAKLQMRMLIDGYINAMLEVFSLKTPFIAHNRFKVIVSLRYGNEFSEMANYLPFAEMILTPINYSVVSGTIARVFHDFDRKFLDQMAAHLLHLVGGHPGCIIDILKNYNQNPVMLRRLVSDEYARSSFEDIVKPRVREIVESIPEGLIAILRNLSFYRVFNTVFLHELIRQGYLEFYDESTLADTLAATYLYKRYGHLLGDSIARRLLSIEQRHVLAPEEFRKRCEHAYDLYLYQLDSVQRGNADEWALECFYQFLQSGINDVQDPAARAAMNRKFQDEIVPDVMVEYFKYSRDFELDRSLLLQKIRKDWELLFTINYSLREDEFNNEPARAFLNFIEAWQPED